MDRPIKRLKAATYDAEDDEDELGLEPAEFAARQDPGYQLEKGRAMAAYKLKSSLEDIFKKYEKDFTGIGDEIDLRTGDIVIDNGHLHSMRDAQDTGERDRSQSEGAEDEDDANTSEEEDRILLGASSARKGPFNVLSRPKTPSQLGSWPRLTSLMGGGLGSRLPAMSALRFPFMGPTSLSLGSFRADIVDPAWSVPELPVAGFTFPPNHAAGGARSHYVNTKRATRQPLRGPEDEVAEDDDILLGVGRTDLQTKPGDRSGSRGALPEETRTTFEIVLKRTHNTATVDAPQPVETAARNVVDPSYAFSDEEEAMSDSAEEEITVAERIRVTEPSSITLRKTQPGRLNTTYASHGQTPYITQAMRYSFYRFSHTGRN
ncbi:hypothetical protein NKR23_g10926 [Pleurostoma richardsiae]|uniref:Uncharacterized protein n=1 Tax=Pleurostoma richardsiae TaxID=41990 RepID=A0AA38RBS4_9PEZI|nr:hypothetical protein NKR23_g10926 [Pleurostoma richardsiae]